jgi:hypothetical protein
MAQTWFLGLAPLPELRSGFLLSAPLSRLGLGKKIVMLFFCALAIAAAAAFVPLSSSWDLL